jgi:alkylation response protein AidB-like acyl-CoA dehydrogenase
MLDISQSCQSSSREEPSGWSADGVSSICANLGKEVEIRPIEAMTNHNTTEVFFDNLEVPPANLIGEEGKGFRYILDGMNAERILVAQECIGDGRWLLQEGIDYAKERIVFDRPIGQNQGVQFLLARAYAELEAADMICRGIVRIPWRAQSRRRWRRSRRRRARYRPARPRHAALLLSVDNS